MPPFDFIKFESLVQTANLFCNSPILAQTEAKGTELKLL